MIIGVIGASDANKSLKEIARQVGREIARRGATLACGGLGGVMEAACEGAREEGGLSIGILPGFDAGDANKYVDLPIVTGLSYARNLVLVRTSDALIAVGGGYGTLSEIAFALKLNKPVIALDSWKVSDKIISAFDAEDAVTKAMELAAASPRPVVTRKVRS